MYDRQEQQKRKMIELRELEKLRQLELDLYGRLLEARRTVEGQSVVGGQLPSVSELLALGALTALQDLVVEHLNTTDREVRDLLALDDGTLPVSWLRGELDKIRKD